MLVSLDVPLMHVNYSDFRWRNPEISSPGVSINKNLNVHFNVLKGYSAHSSKQNVRKLQEQQCSQTTIK